MITTRQDKVSKTINTLKTRLEKYQNGFYDKKLLKDWGSKETMFVGIDSSKLDKHCHFAPDILIEDVSKKMEYWESEKVYKIAELMVQISENEIKLEEAKRLDKKEEDKDTKVQTTKDKLNNLPQVLIDWMKSYESIIKECMSKKNRYSEKEISKIAKMESQYAVLDLVNRVENKCGNIISTSGLSIGAKGEINGFVEGDKDNAYVETIGAGGWNVQKFHFRTLIK